jgi:succinate dehydrogenase/fumarate reductase flavoprotein subunit
VADVVVIGYGPAGAAAAIAAHDAGAEVVVLEKTGAGGGNCRYAGGFLFDAPQAADHIDALSFGRTPRDVVEAYADGLGTLSSWLESLGATIEPFAPPPGRLPASFPSWPSFPAGEDIRYAVVGGGEGRRGEALWRVLDGAVRDRGIDVRFDTPVAEWTGDGVRTAAGEEIAARGGVVLACGGFEGDPGLADAYLPLGPTSPVGHGANDGTGLRIAQAAGAALWHMYGFFGWFAFHAPGFTAPFAIDFFAPGFIMVDNEGRRFSDETGFEVHDRLRALTTYLPDRPNRPALPSWAVFDDATRVAGPLNGLLGTPNAYTWSADNAAEVEAGWIVAADTPDELAERTGLGAELVATIDAYNSSARRKAGDAFGRAPETLVPLEGKLHALPTWPGVAGTTGGPRHDATARVLDPQGQPIPGLYAAGAVSLVWGHLIDHGGGLTDAMVFGRAAGAAAAERAR